MQIADLLQDYEIKEKKGSKRNDLMNQIYSLYYTEQEHILNKKYRWKLYVQWLKENKKPHTKENVLAFKKTKEFKNSKGFSAKTMATFFLVHCDEEMLYAVKSICYDKFNRKQSVGAYIKSLVK